MIIYLSLLAVIVLIGICRDWNSSKSNKIKFLCISFSLLILVAALRHSSVGVDLSHQYADAYKAISNLSWSDWNVLRYERGYFIYCKLLSTISGSVQFFIAVTTVVTFVPVAFFIYKNSRNVFMSTFLFITLSQMFMYYTGLRQVFAISFILLSIEAMKKRYWIVFFLLVFLATQFHESSIIAVILPVLYFAEFRRIGVIISIAGVFVVLLAYRYVFSFASSLLAKYEEGYTEGSRFVNGNISIQSIIVTAAIVFCFVFAYIMIVAKGKGTPSGKRQLSRVKIKQGKLIIRRVNDISLPNGFLLYCTFLAMIFQMFVFTVNILTRFRFYFIPMIYISLPLAAENVPVKYKKVTEIGIYAGYTLYFIYTCVFIAQQQMGVIPYKLFFL